MGLVIERGADREGEVEREKVLGWEGYRSAMSLGRAACWISVAAWCVVYVCCVFMCWCVCVFVCV